MNKRYEVCYKGDQDVIAVFNHFDNSEVEFESGIWREVDKDFFEMILDSVPSEFDWKEVVIFTVEQRLIRIEKMLNDIKADLYKCRKGGKST